jgi:nucleoside-diphosphate-sugar epimerase
MRVFVTGATGFIGSALVRELLETGHNVTGLARSDQAAANLAAAGAEVHRGSLTDLDSLRAGAATADGVIHTAYIHDFSPTGDPAGAARTDGRAIEALGETLAGSGKPLVVASGTALLAPGRPATEEDKMPDDTPHPRVSEQVVLQFAGRGVRVSAMRLPPSVHGQGDHGFVPALIGIARAKGLAAYVGDGSNRWAEADAHFGGFALLASMDVPASSVITQQRYGWRPAQPGADRRPRRGPLLQPGVTAKRGPRPRPGCGPGRT